MSQKKNPLRSLNGSASKGPERRSVVGDAVSGDLLRLQQQRVNQTTTRDLVAYLAPGIATAVEKGILVSVGSNPGSGVVRLRLFDAGENYEFYAADAEWAEALSDALCELLDRVVPDPPQGA